jgi:hypothetical protein
MCSQKVYTVELKEHMYVSKENEVC